MIVWYGRLFGCTSATSATSLASSSIGRTYSNAVRVALLERKVAPAVLQGEAAAFRDGKGSEARVYIETASAWSAHSRGSAGLRLTIALDVRTSVTVLVHDFEEDRVRRGDWRTLVDDRSRLCRVEQVCSLVQVVLTRKRAVSRQYFDLIGLSVSPLTRAPLRERESAQGPRCTRGCRRTPNEWRNCARDDTSARRSGRDKPGLDPTHMSVCSQSADMCSVLCRSTLPCS